MSRGNGPDRSAPRPAESGTAPVLPLAQGDLTDAEAAELLVLKRQIERHAGFRCDAYKEKCLRRRIAVRMRACGVHTYDAYARLLERDEEEYGRLTDTLTINVSKFFRNPEVWDVVRDVVLPELVKMDGPRLQLWSAGTASGEEAYTLSMLVHDFAAAQGITPDRFQILGTDIDRGSLALARRAEYTDFAMTDIDPAVRDRWFDQDGLYRLRPEARANVSFRRHDLIRDSHPQRRHLIVCRNVIIYFERSVQETLFRRFHEALVPGGYLVLGKVEAIFGGAAGLFQPVANRQRVFRKAA
jgi:chemotaxis protein methyltransferase CheR